ncbi:MAG: glycosyltransferase family 4 protein [Gammaproteobacteria bacterium]|nr:glycosyltransferase family 4 protein [Gammaproteobacteria bacterium]
MKAKILIVSNNAHFFSSPRYGLAKGLQELGYEVCIACPPSMERNQTIVDGFQFYAIPLHRGSLNPWKELKLTWSFYQAYKKINPDIIHHFGIKTIIWGNFAAKFIPKPLVVNTPTGLGYVFTNSSKKAKLLKILVLKLYRWALDRPHSFLIFQNPDDKYFFEQQGLIQKQEAFIVKGSGVDPTDYPMAPEPEGKPIVILPARLLWDKGVQEFVDAARQLRSKGVNARFALVGEIDPQNPATVTQKQLDTWVTEGVIEDWGWQKNMVDIFQKAHIVCLPSYREGIPKALLEAASCGKPIVTTDAPGCREVVIDGLNGYLVPVKDSTLLAERLLALITNPALRNEMGKYGRERIIAEFSTEKVIAETVALYQQAYL